MGYQIVDWNIVCCNMCCNFHFFSKCLPSKLCFALVILYYNVHLLFALINGYLPWFTFSNTDAILVSSKNTDYRNWNVKCISLYVQGSQMPVLEFAKCWAEKWNISITLQLQNKIANIPVNYVKASWTVGTKKPVWTLILFSIEKISPFQTVSFNDILIH